MRTKTKPAAGGLQQIAHHPQWAELPANARYFFALAAKAGLAIEHDGRAWAWTGTVEQHQAAGVWDKKLNWSFKRRRTAWIPEGMEARLYRHPSSPNVIRAVIEHVRPFVECGENRHTVRRFMDRASHDKTYSTFMAQALTAVDVSGDDVPKPSAAPKQDPAVISSEDTYRWREFHDAIGPWDLDAMKSVAARTLVRASELDLKGLIIIAPHRNGKEVICNAPGLSDAEALGLLAQMSYRIAAAAENKLGDGGDEADEDA